MRKVSVYTIVMLISLFTSFLMAETSAVDSNLSARRMENAIHTEDNVAPAVEWNMTYGGALHDETRSVIQTSDGGYAMAGWTNSFGYESNSAFWLIKTNSEGNMLWNQTYSNGQIDKAFSVLETSDGGYVVSGHSGEEGGLVIWTDANGNMMWNKTYGARCERIIKTSDGGYAIFIDTPAGIIKIDATGTVQWSKTYSGYAYQIVQTSDGGYAITGLKPLFPVTERQVWLLRTDVNGDLLWERNYGGLAYAVSIGYSFVQTDDGGFSIVAAVESVQGAPADAWLFKTDADGNMMWNRTFGGVNDDCPYWMIQTIDKGYAVAGFTNSYGAGDYDFWVCKTDVTGNPDWNQTYGGINHDEALSIIQTSDNGYAAAGITSSLGAGDLDFWLIKLRGSGPKTWVVDDDGPADFSTIQAAINAAIDGDTVFVKAGTYAHFTVDKSVNLCGENKYTTIIDGTAYEEAAILVQASSVNISNFTIQNGKPDMFIGNRQPVITANITIADNIMKDSQEGVIRFVYTSNSILTGNFINGTMAGGGVNFDWANDTWVYNNTVTQCWAAINGGYPSYNNTFQNNNFIDNTYCVFMNNVFDDSRFFHNNFINNSLVHLTSSETCFWDNGYPSGGNYWSNYVGTDTFCGASQNETGSDNIGDSPYLIDENNVDNYPLIRPYVPFENQTIYIRADGSVDPSGAPILRKGDLYTLTSSITSNATNGIVVERDNIVVDGSGFTVEGTGAILFRGVYLNGGSNVTIKNTAIEAFDCGIFLSSSSNNIIGNNITANNYCGIWLYSPSSGNSISGNNITNNGVGMLLDASSNNIVTGNNIANNWFGIYLSRSSNNCIAQNNLTANNWFGMRLDSSSNNNITENTITDGSIGDARAAISLLSSSYCNVARNSLERNSKGLYFEYADDTTVVENEIVGNLEGFSITSCSNTFIIHNSFIDNTKYFILNSTNLWNASYPSGGNYWNDYNGIDFYHGPSQNETSSDGMGDTPYVIDANNTDRYPLMKAFPWSEHDIGITYIGRVYSFDLVVPLKTIVGLGFSLNISTFVMNYGNQTETFNVQIYANDTLVDTFANVTLESRQSAILSLRWDTTGFAYGNYTVRAVADNVSGETDVSDNAYTDGLVYVGIPGDITGPNGWPDGKCDMRDIGYVARRFMVTPTHPLWDPNADINNDLKVDMRDIGTVARHFGEHL